MQKIPVIRHPKRSTDFHVIDAADVIKVELVRNRDIIIHTKEEQFYLYCTLESMEELLFEEGFRMIDSDNIVNMNHVTTYDPAKGAVFLGDPNQPNTKTASAARIHKQHIENILSILQAEKKLEQNELTPDLITLLFEKIMEQNEDEQFLRSYATLHAVNERKKAEQKIQYMAYHDALTSLPNRLQFYDQLNKLFANCKSNTVSGILFLDLDRFKVINDSLGHHVGDLLLKHTSMKLLNHIGPNDIVARFGGDEFIILLAERQSIQEILDFTNRIPDILNQPFHYEEHMLFTTASIGISIFPNDSTNADTLIKQADTAMYIAKESGGNTHRVYHSSMDFQSMERLNMEMALRFALERNEIMVYYQPLIDLSTNQVFGMEALLRWNSAEMGWVSPEQFIPLAEETGLIIPIGNYVLREACRQNKQWMDQGFGPFTVCVNISVNQFYQPGFVKTVKDTLKETGIKPELLCLEITENVAMKHITQLTETMNELKQLDIKISIDDFGTGYSSLNYLKRFQVHTLKIDQSFIKDLTHDKDNAAIVTALIVMSQQLKIKSLAEGVETREQLQFLRDIGCNEIQGYIYSQALCADEFENLIRESRPLNS